MLFVNKTIYAALNDTFWRQKLLLDYDFIPEAGNYSKCYFLSKRFYSYGKDDDVKKYIQVPGAGVRDVLAVSGDYMYNHHKYKNTGCIFIIDTLGRLWETTPDLLDYQNIATPNPVECFTKTNGDLFRITYKDINGVYYMYNPNFTSGDPFYEIKFTDPKPLRPGMVIFDDGCVPVIDINHRAYIISAVCDKIIRLKSKDTKRFRYIGVYYDIVATIDCYSGRLYVFVLDLFQFSVKKCLYIDRDVENVIVKWGFIVYKKKDGSVFYFKTRCGQKIDYDIVKLDGVTDIWDDDSDSKVYCQTEEQAEIPADFFHKVTTDVRTVCDRGSYQIAYHPN